MARITFMNTEIDNLSMTEAVSAIEDLIIRRIPSYVVTPNVDHLVQLEKGGELCNVYENADLILADGMPLIWISRWYGTPIKEKISGADIFPHICEMAANKGYSIFLLGAAKGVAAKAAENIQSRFKGLNISGTYSPPYGFENDDNEINKIITMIRKASPDILIVGLGCPKQEKFIYKYKDLLGVPVSMGLGASIDFAAGNIKRAPKWMSEHGLEWLFRIMQDPRRLARRYLVNDRIIFTMALKYKKLAKKQYTSQNNQDAYEKKLNVSELSLKI